MSLIPKITVEDVRLSLNGTWSANSGSVTFWGQSVSSGSVLAQINLANIYLYGVLGTSIMDSQDTITSFHVRTCELDLSCMRVITLLSGDVIIDGFGWTAGITISQPLILATYRNLQNEFKESAQLHLRILQPISISVEGPVSNYRDTAPSMF